MKKFTHNCRGSAPVPALNQWGDRGGIAPTGILFTRNLLIKQDL
jgi:hypothetical protein